MPTGIKKGVSTFLLLSAAAPVLAHSARLWCYVENHQVYVEAFFMGGKPVQGGEILVVDKRGKELLRGRTDSSGQFDFAPPFEDDMKILLGTESEHNAEFKLKREDFLNSRE